MFESLKWITTSIFLQKVIFVMFVYLILSAIAAYWPLKIAGPITKRERKQLSFFRKFVYNVFLPLSLISFLLLLLLILFPIKEPFVLVLHSRTRAPQQKSDNLRPKSKQYSVVDIGPFISHVLGKMEEEGAQSWVTGSKTERTAAKKILLHYIEQIEWQGLKKSAISLEQSSLPPWLIESTEISTTELLYAKYNIKQIRIASGFTQNDATGWPLAALVLSAKNIPTVCIDPIYQKQSFYIPMILDAKVETIGSQNYLSWQCVVDGKFSDDMPDVVKLQLHLVNEQQNSFPLSIKIERDIFSKRLVSEEVPIPPEWNLPKESCEWYVVAPQHKKKVEDARSSPPFSLKIKGIGVDKWDNLFSKARQIIGSSD